MNKATLYGALLTLVVVLAAVVLYWPNPTPPPPAPAGPPADSQLRAPATGPTTTTAIIGQSVEGRVIEAHTFGTGDTDLLLVGGIHGGYEGNTVEFAEALMAELHRQPDIIPENLTVRIIPNLNPDGYALPTTASNFDRRMNANGVDLNRNFDCLWSPTGRWQSTETSGGTAPFSEPEAAALRDYVLALEDTLVGAVFWHSKANAVYTSECGLGTGAAPLGQELMQTYAAAGGYTPAGMWTAYPVTGAAEDWLATLDIPAVTVEFETHEDMEWERNWAGVQATLELFGE